MTETYIIEQPSLSLNEQALRIKMLLNEAKAAKKEEERAEKVEKQKERCRQVSKAYYAKKRAALIELGLVKPPQTEEEKLVAKKIKNKLYYEKRKAAKLAERVNVIVDAVTETTETTASVEPSEMPTEEAPTTASPSVEPSEMPTETNKTKTNKSNKTKTNKTKNKQLIIVEDNECYRMNAQIIDHLQQQIHQLQEQINELREKLTQTQTTETLEPDDVDIVPFVPYLDELL